jgi:precorrin-2 dehydrogenase/sirohydrochlorin ferrochelatase
MMRDPGHEMTFLPVSINISGKQILIVGGGKIACHKSGFLEQFTKSIFVVAPDVSVSIKEKGILFKEKPYEKSDLEGVFLVYACTNIKSLNRQIKADAENLGILVNVADDPELSDFVSPAIYKNNNMTVAVGSNALNVRKSIAIRNKIKEFLKDDQAFLSHI